MEKEIKDLQEFAEGLELTVLNDDDAVLLGGLAGTSSDTNNCNCPNVGYCPAL